MCQTVCQSDLRRTRALIQARARAGMVEFRVGMGEEGDSFRVERVGEA